MSKLLQTIRSTAKSILPSKQKHGKAKQDFQSQQHSSMLMLLIRTNIVGLYPPPLQQDNITDDLVASTMVTIPPTFIPDSNYTQLLSGTLADFIHYSRGEHAQWLIDISHDICDPRLRRGSLQVWDAATQTWANVNGNDHLIGSTYLYNVQVLVSLSKISHRIMRSRTPSAVAGNATTMANHVYQRDGRCWMSAFPEPSVNSHICPKRMGNQLLRIIYNDFVLAPSGPPPDLSIYSDICGITLFPTINVYFDKYEVGLRLVGPVRHSFSLVFHYS